MPQLSPALSRRAAQRWGIFTVDELLDDGLEPRQVHRMVQSRSLIAVHPGVYRAASTPHSFEGRCAAACLADTEAVITGPAAARLWGFRHVFVTDVPGVLVAHDRTPVTRGVRLRRTNVLE